MVHIYLGFLIIGALGLLSSLIFGEFSHDGDIGHDLSGDAHGDSGDADSPKLFSLRAIFAFLMAFAIGGGAMYLSDKSLGAQVIVGFLSGGGTAVLVYYFMKFLYSFQGNSNVDSNTFIGEIGTVTIPTTSTGLCQVKLNTQGANDSFMAQEENSKPLKQHDAVKITGKIGNTLIVSKQ